MQKTSDVTKCSICCSTFVDPKVLPCVHTFCLRCLQTSNKDKQPTDRLSCPLCQEQFSQPERGLAALPINYFVQKRIEIDRIQVLGRHQICETCGDKDDDKGSDTDDDTRVSAPRKATVYCLDCQQHFCSSCQQAHDKMRLNKSHKVITPGRVQQDSLARMTLSFCDKHRDEQVKHFCLDCSAVICLSCYVEVHSTHRCSNIGIAAEAERARMQSDIDRVQDQSVKLQGTSKELEAAMEKIEAQVTQLSNDLQILRAAKTDQIRSAKRLNSRHQLMMDTFTRYAQEVKDQATDSELLRCAKTMQERAKALSVVRTDSDASKAKIEFTPLGRIRPEMQKQAIDASQLGNADFLRAYKKPMQDLSDAMPEKMLVAAITTLERELYVFVNTPQHAFAQQTISLNFSTTTPADISGYFQPVQQGYGADRQSVQPTFMSLQACLRFSGNSMLLSMQNAQPQYLNCSSSPKLVQNPLVQKGTFSVPENAVFWSRKEGETESHSLTLTVQNRVRLTIDFKLTFNKSQKCFDFEASDLKLTKNEIADNNSCVFKGNFLFKNVRIFDAAGYELRRDLVLSDLGRKAINDAVSCSYFNCVYFSDATSNAIHRLDGGCNANIGQWSVPSFPQRLTVTSMHHTLLVTLNDLIVELSPTDGTIIKEISLTGFTDPRRAIRLANQKGVDAGNNSYLVLCRTHDIFDSYGARKPLQFDDQPRWGGVVSTSVDVNDCISMQGVDNSLCDVKIGKVEKEHIFEKISAEDQIYTGCTSTVNLLKVRKPSQFGDHACWGSFVSTYDDDKDCISMQKADKSLHSGLVDACVDDNDCILVLGEDNSLYSVAPEEVEGKRKFEKISAEDQIRTLYIVDPLEVRKPLQFGDQPPLGGLVDVCVDDNGCILVLGEDNSLYAVAPEEVEGKRKFEKISAKGQIVPSSNRIHLDNETGRLYVWISGSDKLKVFNIRPEKLAE